MRLIVFKKINNDSSTNEEALGGSNPQNLMNATYLKP